MYGCDVRTSLSAAVDLELGPGGELQVAVGNVAGIRAVTLKDMLEYRCVREEKRG